MFDIQKALDNMPNTVLAPADGANFKQDAFQHVMKLAA